MSLNYSLSRFSGQQSMTAYPKTGINYSRKAWLQNWDPQTLKEASAVWEMGMAKSEERG